MSCLKLMKSNVERALASASRCEFLEPFLMNGSRLSGLLGQHIRAVTAYRDFLMHVGTRLATPASARINEWGETLTHREQDVLRYLATDLALPRSPSRSSSRPTPSRPTSRISTQARGCETTCGCASGSHSRPTLRRGPDLAR